MANHPNRGTGSKSKNPTPKEIKEARVAAGLSQTAAAEMVHTTWRTWQQWEADTESTSAGGHSLHRRMHPAFWELFQIKAKSLMG